MKGRELRVGIVSCPGREADELVDALLVVLRQGEEVVLRLLLRKEPRATSPLKPRKSSLRLH